ncbi:MAG: PAS domain S-box protein, partial [Burkholderiales bacterium]
MLTISREKTMHAERLMTFSRIAAALAAAAGVVVLLGWALDVAALKSILPGLASMKANTALAFVLCGAALWLLAAPDGVPTPVRNSRGAGNWIARGCAAAAGLLGMLSLGEHLFSWDFGIDQLLFQDRAQGSSYPGRMAPATAANFVLLAAALLLADRGARGWRWPAQWLVLAVALSSFVAVLGYAYGVEALYGVAAYGSMALHTALTFLVLCAGLMCARPDRGLMIVATADGAGGMLFRLLFPAAVLVPVVVGWLWVGGQEIGYYSMAFGTAMFATANTVIFCALVWWTARSVQGMEAVRRQAESSLLESETRLRTVIDSALSAVVVIDARGRIADWNVRAEKIFGWRREESIGRELAEKVIPPRHRDAHRRGLQRFLATGEGPVLDRLIEITALRRDGSEFPVELSISPLGTGDAVMFCGFVTDITERKQAEQALVAERTLLRTLIDALPDVVFTKDTEGRFSMCNAAELKHLGLAREGDLVGKSVFDLYPRELAQSYHADDLRALAGQSMLNREEPSVDAAGNQRWYLTTKVPLRDRDGKISGLVGISRDITERKQAEEAFRKNQELLQAVAENSPAIIWVKDMEGRYQLINGRYQDLIRLPREEIIGKTDYDIFPQSQADVFRAVDRRALAAGRAVEAEEEVPKDDGIHTLLSLKSPLWDETGKPYALFGISTDITDRKRAEQRLQTQLGRMNLLDQITRAIGQRQDLHGIFQEVVRTLEERLPIDFGFISLYDAAEESLTITRVGMKSRALALELAMPEHARIDIDRNGLSRCVRGQLVHEPDVAQVPFPFPQRLARGGLRSLVAAPLLVESKVFGVLVAARREPRGFSSSDCEFLRQLSEHVALAAHQAQLYGALQQAYDDLRQTQNAVMQQERLRALGQMASGIAHDIDNAISPVALYT